MDIAQNQQQKQKEWFDQWSMLQDDELFLFQDWISPLTLQDFKGASVLECGCGGGQHTSFVAPYAESVTAVDLNTVALAKERNASFSHVEFVEDDLAKMKLGRKFDIVFSVGVIHHTDNPDESFRNISSHAKPGGKVVVWVYSKEGNWLVANLVEPFRKLFLAKLNRKFLLIFSGAITFALYLPVFTVYLLPLKFLPYFEYFGNFRRMSFYRNLLNVFDKLNAPQVDFISADRIRGWYRKAGLEDVVIKPYKGVSWTGYGIVPLAERPTNN